MILKHQIRIGSNEKIVYIAIVSPVRVIHCNHMADLQLIL